jgi:predicted nucleic acid-binding protein
MKIYLDTSVFNWYFDFDKTFHPATLRLFEEIKAGKFIPYTSGYVTDELNACKDDIADKRIKMLNLIPKFSIKVLQASDLVP